MFMLRTILCVAVALFVCVEVAAAKGSKTKSTGPVVGTIKSTDAATGTLTVTVTGKKGSKDHVFTVSDTTPISIDSGTTPNSLKGKDGLKDPAVKEGASIQVTSDASGAVVVVSVGGNYSTPHRKKKG
jgi:hypothetical protein